MFRHGVHVIDVLHGELTKGAHGDESAVINHLFMKILKGINFLLSSPEPLPYLLLVVPGVELEVLHILRGQPRLSAILVTHKPPPLS